MFNVTGGELLLIFMVALIVLGPERLPDAARKAGRAMAQIRDLSNGFQRELRSAFDEPDQPIIRPEPRPQLTAIDGGAGRELESSAAVPTPMPDGGEALAVVATSRSLIDPREDRGEDPGPPRAETTVGTGPHGAGGDTADADAVRSVDAPSVSTERADPGPAPSDETAGA